MNREHGAEVFLEGAETGFKPGDLRLPRFGPVEVGPKLLLVDASHLLYSGQGQEAGIDIVFHQAGHIDRVPEMVVRIQECGVLEAFRQGSLPVECYLSHHVGLRLLNGPPRSGKDLVPAIHIESSVRRPLDHRFNDCFFFFHISATNIEKYPLNLWII